MKIIKGFVTIGQYVNNVPGSLSPIGELSTWSTTYSKEKGEYQNTAVPGYKLVTFRCADSVTGVETVVTEAEVNQIIAVVRDCVAYAFSHLRPYDSADFRNTVLANHYETISDFGISTFVDSGSIALPEWISWNGVGVDGTSVKIWLSDQAFKDQYDEYSITVIPPLDDLNSFFNSFSVAGNLLNARSVATLGDLIQDTKGTNPETYMRILNFDFVNKFNPEQKMSTNWAMLIYGKVGDNIDAIKDAIVEYVLFHSTHTRTEWEEVLPDLFKRTEFVMLPRWDKVAIPNLTELSSLYQSMLDPVECIAFAKANIPFYTNDFINNNVLIFPYDYKAITIVSVNGMTNVNEKRTLSGIFPDYIPINTSSPDFNRMQLKTQAWVLFFERLLITAETATRYSSIPPTQRRIIRNDALFISAVYDNVNYLVAARINNYYSGDEPA